jgi:hypothetical protein
VYSEPFDPAVIADQIRERIGLPPKYLVMNDLHRRDYGKEEHVTAHKYLKNRQCFVNDFWLAAWT